MNKLIIIALFLFAIGQALIWYQTNTQFFSEWARQRPLLMATMGLPISYILILGTRYAVQGFNGLLWPGRLVGFASGMVVMTVLTYIHLGEGITLKTAITLLLAFIIVLIQLFWK